MSLNPYGVLKCKALGSSTSLARSRHYQVHVLSSLGHSRIAINIRSQGSPSVLLFYVDENFDNPITEALHTLPYGFTELKKEPNHLALDYIRGGLFDIRMMRPLPDFVEGPDNDLTEKIDSYFKKAILSHDAVVYAFGERWGPEPFIDYIFGFKPGYGVHNIHMNQGNTRDWRSDNGVWQDGGLFIYLPSEDKWVAIFLAFQSQSFNTHDQTGNAKEYLKQ